MLNSVTLADFRYKLDSKRRQIQEELSALDRDDPLMVQLVENDDIGGQSLQSDLHNKIVTLKGNLFDLYLKVGDSLSRIKNGTYGVCQKCGKEIEFERLVVLPTAASCKTCA